VSNALGTCLSSPPRTAVLRSQLLYARVRPLTACFQISKKLQKKQQADFAATPRFCVAILDVLHTAGDWKGINEHIVLLTKRRAQLKQAVGALVKRAMSFIDLAPSLAVKTELIETLNTVTSGKIFVEVEKARLTRALAKIKEEAGKTSEAAEIMQEVAVETYGALSKHEKLFFIEEQVRLCLDKKDFIRAQILSRKINPRSFDEIVKADKKAAVEAARKAGEDVRQMDLDAAAAMSIEEKAKAEKAKNANVDHAEGYFELTDPTIPPVAQLKLNYYNLMIRFHGNEGDYLEMCRCYRNVMACEVVVGDVAKWTPSMKKAVWFVVLSANGPMQQDLLHQIASDPKLNDLPLHKQLTKQFTTKEIIHWDTLAEAFASEMASETEIFGGEKGDTRKEDLRQRVIEHNLLVVGAYYKNVTLVRLGELLCLDSVETEKRLSDLVRVAFPKS
jgi:26S proteasome regulatory subunit N5|tara:strand:+ start:3168 stop:4508 length:1341 start_codon:yes stop_codon:yes gene_type:complete